MTAQTDRAELAALAAHLAPSYRAGDVAWCPDDGAITIAALRAISRRLPPGLALWRPYAGPLAYHIVIGPRDDATPYSRAA
jgi:hypothetical protein